MVSHFQQQVVGGMPAAKYRLQRITGTREADALEGQPPPTLRGLEDYAEGTTTQLLALQVGHTVPIEFL